MWLFWWQSILIYFDLDNLLLDEKRHEIISTYGIAYKTTYGKKSLRIIFSKYLALFYSEEKCKRICDRIRFLLF